MCMRNFFSPGPRSHWLTDLAALTFLFHSISLLHIRSFVPLPLSFFSVTFLSSTWNVSQVQTRAFFRRFAIVHAPSLRIVGEFPGSALRNQRRGKFIRRESAIRRCADCRSLTDDKSRGNYVIRGTYNFYFPRNIECGMPSLRRLVKLNRLRLLRSV